MKTFNLFIVGCLFFLVGRTAAWADQPGHGAGRPFVVVELFGSEGCSSCPPADDILRSLTATARDQGKNIFTLSFHVDYWNYLGWRDPFSKQEFTQRQQQYAEVFQKASVYTPQMVVNGAHEFVGSDERSARAYVDQYLAVEPLNAIKLTVADNKAEEIKVSFECRGQTADTVLNVALVEGGIESQVTRGENAGRLLKHENVVRGFKVIRLTGEEGSFSFSKEEVKDLSRSAVVAYLQRISDMRVIAAESVSLSD